MNNDNKLCNCNSGLEYNNCCELYISGKKIPDTPEQLMRSRYTAYTIANIDYIFDTMRDSALKEACPKESLKWAKNSKWLGLKILKSSIDKDNITGDVEFIASYIIENKKHDLKEHSKFKKYDGKWYYVGTIADYISNQNKVETVRLTDEQKIGRNDPCFCGSGKKYKKCCCK